MRLRYFLLTILPLLAQVQQASLEQPKPVLSGEARGDIFMARKMYREAIEVYREGPADSAVMLNKIGIAYHQMVELDAARKLYEKAIKTLSAKADEQRKTFESYLVSLNVL